VNDVKRGRAKFRRETQEYPDKVLEYYSKYGGNASQAPMVAQNTQNIEVLLLGILQNTQNLNQGRQAPALAN